MKKLTSTIPTRCVERHPTSQTVWFAGVPINLSELSKSYKPKMGHGYLSKIFKGERKPSLKWIEQIATGLGMQRDAFIDHLKELW